jgi:hypothetical protein
VIESPWFTGACSTRNSSLPSAYEFGYSVPDSWVLAIRERPYALLFSDTVGGGRDWNEYALDYVLLQDLTLNLSSAVAGFVLFSTLKKKARKNEDGQVRI